MNNVVPWLKANWLIVLLGVFSLAVMPTAWYFADGMRTKVKEQIEKDVGKDIQELSNAKVQYHVVTPVGDKILEKTTEPNKVYTDWYRTVAETIKTSTGQVSQAALDFNMEGHTLLVQDLFPDPADFAAEAKLREFAAAYIRAHPVLLRSMNAGDPPNNLAVSDLLSNFQLAETERIKTQTGAEPTEDDRTRIAQTLRDMRLREYQRRASEISVYAGPYVFPDVPAAPPIARPAVSQCWDWQERYWIHQDICRAISLVNGGASGSGVPGSVVKRIVKISADRPPYVAAENQTISEIPTEAGTDKAPTDFSRSLTGRISGPGTNNKWYDVRPVTVELIVSSRRMPEFFDALARTNFMTILDMDVFNIDPVEELRSGYYYGDADPVVRVVFSIETIWLREWRANLMPRDVRAALGLLEGVSADAEAAPAPAPRPAPQPADDDLGGGRGRRGGGGGD